MLRTLWTLTFFASFAAFAGCGGPAPASDAGSDAPPIDAAPECRMDAECDDGLVCNGVEHCTSGVCRAGTPMHCDDGIACTTDACSEALARCVSRVPDLDGDGDGDAACVNAMGTPLGTDCDDADPNRFTGNPELCDAAHHDEDCALSTLGGRDDDGDGFVSALCCVGTTCGDDCDDTRGAVHPGATEACNRIDDDCNGMVDEGVAVTGFADGDRDGYGDPSMPTTACGTAVGFAALGTDCDDANAAVHPGQPELCDGIDNDCDTATAIDANAQTVTWYRDADGDGYGTPSTTMQSCAPPAGYAILGSDCDDTTNARSPGVAELCNGIDDDCSGTADFVIAPGDGEDDDGDGVPDAMCHDPRASDCDDHDPTSTPGAIEACDGRDNDCDGRIDENAAQVAFYRDADHDGFGDDHAVSVGCVPPAGFSRRGGDCDDTQAARFPGALEGCDGVDDDCDVAIDEGPSAAAGCAYPHGLGVCTAGACRLASCAPGFGDCTTAAGCETDLRSDVAHCGRCTTSCTATQLCQAGTCMSECTPSQACTPTYCEWGTTCSGAGTCGTTTSCGPMAIETRATGTTPEAGPGGTQSTRLDCPIGELPYGIEARVADATVDGGLTELALLCGRPAFAGSSVTLAPTSRQPPGAGTPCCNSGAGAPSTLACPTGSALVGFTGSASGASLRTLGLRCAPLSVTGTSAAATLAIGAATDGTGVLGGTAATPFAGSDCPAGRLATGIGFDRDDATQTVATSFQLSCGTPALRIATTSPLSAGSGGALNVVDCPPGQVPIAVHVAPSWLGSFYDGVLARFSVDCGFLELYDASPGYTVDVSPGGATYGPFGSYFADPATTLACAPGEAIVGVAGGRGYQLAIRCAPIQITGDLTSGFVTSYGSVTQSAMVGTRTGTPYGPDDCPAGTVASGFYVYAGDIIDGLSLRCAPPIYPQSVVPPG